MIERVARALRGAGVSTGGKHGLTGETADEHVRALARAAIEAMREPTQQMRLAGIAEWSRPEPTPEHESTLVFNAIWRAMIDEALR